jgi:hypothetical protein
MAQHLICSKGCDSGDNPGLPIRAFAQPVKFVSRPHFVDGMTKIWNSNQYIAHESAEPPPGEQSSSVELALPRGKPEHTSARRGSRIELPVVA